MYSVQWTLYNVYYGILILYNIVKQYYCEEKWRQPEKQAFVYSMLFTLLTKQIYYLFFIKKIIKTGVIQIEL